MPDAVLCDYVQRQAIYLLGDRVESVRVDLGDHDSSMHVTIRLSDGWQHAVGGPTFVVRQNPEKWTEAACDALVAWLNVRAAVALARNEAVTAQRGARHWATLDRRRSNGRFPQDIAAG